MGLVQEDEGSVSLVLSTFYWAWGLEVMGTREVFWNKTCFGSFHKATTALTVT